LAATTVAVTGAEGFIGSHLVEALVAAGHHVRAMVQYNSFGTRGWLDSLDDEVLAQVTVVMGDVRDPRSVLALTDGCEVVYHLAALIAIPYSYDAPRSYVDTNVTGTLNVLEAARSIGTPRLVHTSTSETYGSARFVPIDEQHPLQAQSPYAASKIAADKLVESYHLSFDLPVVTLRPFNTFGPRQSARAVIPTVIAQLSAGTTELKLGALDPVRDFTYCADTAAAFLAVGSAGDHVVGGLFNAGTGRGVSIGELVQIICHETGREATIVQQAERLRPPRSEVERLICDASKLAAATSWKPEHSLEEGLARTIAWFTDPGNLARYRPLDYNK
jgi:NDP-hexose 4,6-dehydratase